MVVTAAQEKIIDETERRLHEWVGRQTSKTQQDLSPYRFAAAAAVIAAQVERENDWPMGA